VNTETVYSPRREADLVMAIHRRLGASTQIIQKFKK